jgi:hypothetical protein
MFNVPELPSKFQNAFEVEKAKAELEYATRAQTFPYYPQLADDPLHQLLLIQRVFFAYCTHARNACRAGDWTAARVSQSIEVAWPLIFDSYFIREHGTCSEEEKSSLRAATRRTITDDPQWRQHLSEFAALAAKPELAGATVPTEEAAASAKGESAPARSKRLQSTVTSAIATRRMEAYLESNGIGQTEFAVEVGTTDRTLRTFRKTGKVRRDIFDSIATKMGTTRELLLKPE